VDRYRQGNDTIASLTPPQIMARPKFPLLFNPILFVGVTSIVLWALILTAIALVWH
jgi:hypothetical protein